MKNNKYYTPEIIEFRPLFEYEWLNNVGEWKKHVFRTDSKNNSEKYNIPDNKEFIDGDKNLHRQIFKYIEGGRIRVKYLDKEDILECGFTETTYNGVECYEHRNYRLTKFEGNPVLSIDFFRNDVSDQLFRGVIKNKSELKILINQLGIENEQQ